MKRCGSRSSSRAEKLFECPLCGVALRNRRFSKRGAMSRITSVDLRVDGVPARSGRGRDVSLVEDEEALGGSLTDVLEERVAVLGPAQDLMRDDEPRVRPPRVHAEAALLAAASDERPVHDLEVEAEPLLHLVAPLETHRRGADDQHELDALAEKQLLRDEPRLDGLSEADVVSDEHVRARQRKRLLQWRELMAHQLDAGPERGLKQLGVGGRHAVPLQRVQVGGEVPRRVDARHVAEAVSLRLVHLGAKLQLPKDLERPPLVVVIEADELDQRRVALLGRRHHVLHEPLPVTNLHDVALPWRVARDLMRSEERPRRGALRRAVSLEETRSQLGTCATRVIETVRSTHGLQFVAPEQSEQLSKADSTRSRQRFGLNLLRSVRRYRHREGAP